MAEDVEFLTDYLVTEYGVHKEENSPFSRDSELVSGLVDDEYASEDEEILELFF